MAAAIALREDYDGPMLRRLARASQDAKQTRRLLSLAVIYDGGRRSEAADLGGVTLQIIRDWVLRFKATCKNAVNGKKRNKRRIHIRHNPNNYHMIDVCKRVMT